MVVLRSHLNDDAGHVPCLSALRQAGGNTPDDPSQAAPAAGKVAVGIVAISVAPRLADSVGPDPDVAFIFYSERGPLSHSQSSDGLVTNNTIGNIEKTKIIDIAQRHWALMNPRPVPITANVGAR